MTFAFKKHALVTIKTIGDRRSFKLILTIAKVRAHKKFAHQNTIYQFVPSPFTKV